RSNSAFMAWRSSKVSLTSNTTTCGSPSIHGPLAILVLSPSPSRPLSRSPALPLSRSALILFIADLLHPVHDRAIKRFLQSNVGHGRGGCSAMPVFLPRRGPDHVSWMNRLDRTIPALRTAAPCRHDQGLAQRVGMPGGARTRLEGHAGGAHMCRIGCLNQRVNADRTSKILGRSFASRL